MGNKKGIFEMWLKNFALTVFMQSFHAVFFMMILRLISGIYGTMAQNTSMNVDGIASIIVIIAVLMLTKMEKFFKQTFGVGTAAFMGSVGENALKGFGGIMSAVNLAQRTAEPFKERKKVASQIRQNQAKIDKAESRLNSLNSGQGGRGGTSSDGQSNALSSSLYQQAKTQKAEGNMDGYHTFMQNAADAKRLEGSGGSNSGSGKGNPSDAQKWKLEDDLEELYAQQNNLETASKSLPLKAFTRLGSTAASLGFGMGAAEDLTGAITVSNLVDMPLDAIGDRIADKNANARMYAANKERAYNAGKEGDAKKAEIYEKNAESNKAVAIDNRTLKELKNIWKEGSNDIASGFMKSERVKGKNGETIKINNTTKNVITPRTQIKKIDDAF